MHQKHPPAKVDFLNSSAPPGAAARSRRRAAEAAIHPANLPWCLLPVLFVIAHTSFLIPVILSSLSFQGGFLPSLLD
jgi:hypothetical protein